MKIEDIEKAIRGHNVLFSHASADNDQRWTFLFNNWIGIDVERDGLNVKLLSVYNGAGWLERPEGNARLSDGLARMLLEIMEVKNLSVAPFVAADEPVSRVRKMTTGEFCHLLMRHSSGCGLRILLGGYEMRTSVAIYENGSVDGLTIRRTNFLPELLMNWEDDSYVLWWREDLPNEMSIRLSMCTDKHALKTFDIVDVRAVLDETGLSFELHAEGRENPIMLEILDDTTDIVNDIFNRKELHS